MSASSKAQEKTLAELKANVKLLKRLWKLNLQSYIDILSKGGPGAFKASMRATIDTFLKDNGVILTNMVALDQVEALKYLDGSVKGELEAPAGVMPGEPDPLLASLEPVGPADLMPPATEDANEDEEADYVDDLV